MSQDFQINPELKLSDFDYSLPEEKIAYTPKKDRASSKLLIFRNGDIKEDIYANIHQHLDENHFLVFNNSRVVQARLQFFTASEKTIEVFCLEPADKNQDQTVALQSKGNVLWRCFVGNLKKWKEKEINRNYSLDNGVNLNLRAELVERESDAFIIRLSWEQDLTFAEVLEAAGRIPLPPYIEREATEEDNITYQTIYAKDKGSVAAPTAGLHFTEVNFKNFDQSNISYDYLTLHVGAGTFKPVKSDDVTQHSMHDEQILIEKSFIQNLLAQIQAGKRIVAIGTTSARFLESIFWLGCKNNLDINHVFLGQWEPYGLKSDRPETSLKKLVSFMDDHGISKIQARTAIMIMPGYKWRLVDKLVTNFHQPKSTLIMLVASFIGQDWKRVYQYALENDFRFLSYGDGCLLEKS